MLSRCDGFLSGGSITTRFCSLSIDVCACSLVYAGKPESDENSRPGARSREPDRGLPPTEAGGTWPRPSFSYHFSRKIEMQLFLVFSLTPGRSSNNLVFIIKYSSPYLFLSLIKRPAPHVLRPRPALAKRGNRARPSETIAARTLGGNCFLRERSTLAHPAGAECSRM